MAAVKIIMRNEQKKDGTYPLAIRITKNRKSSYIYLDYTVRPEDWDAKAQRVKKGYPNSTRMNNFLAKKLSDAMDAALKEETHGNVVSAHAVRKKIKPSASATFFAQADAYLAGLKAAGKYSQYNADKSRIKHFKEFIGHDIAFQDITPLLLERFKTFLMAPRKDKKSRGERAAINHYVMIRSVFSVAIRDNVVEAEFYPFGKGKIKIKFPDTNKIGLTAEEVKKLEEVELPSPVQSHARNLWLLSFYFAGMRVSDVLRLNWSDIQDGRLHYSMGKNNKGGSFKVPEKAARILEQYEAFKDNKSDLIFSELRGCDFENKFATQRTINYKTSSIDKILRNDVAPAAEIDKTLTMHIARHTFGNIAGDKIHIQMLQKLYRHSSITTTIGYQSNFIHKETDDALDLVIGG